MAFMQLVKRQFSANADDGKGPSLWVFLIIVLGVLLALVTGTSAIMHLIQARQRRSLARRIANGEVDLEQLGLKRLNVPQEQINKMPQYVFNADQPGDIKMPEPAATSSTSSPSDNRRSTMYAQSTCSICLDDFIDKETTVRELPCNHIFHPECIDPFLKNNSSLCPLCKKSSLPPGFCPVNVTNVMVRRERLGRHVRGNRRNERLHSHLVTHYVRSPAQRERAAQQAAAAAATTTTTAPATDSTTTTPETTEQPQDHSSNQDIELVSTQPQSTPAPMEAIPPEIAMQGREARRQWRRERLARQHSADFDAQGEEARMAEARRPFWRRMLGIA